MNLVTRELSQEEVKQYGLDTMAVDQYGNLTYNPAWVQEQTDAVMKTGIAHEVMHVTLNHLRRLGSRQHQTWNIAVDARAAVNEILSHSFTIPDQWVRIQKMAGKSAEEIYDWIIKNAQTYKCPSSGGFDDHIALARARSRQVGENARNIEKVKG
jgi:predicted metal-dependent peptidase